MSGVLMHVVERAAFACPWCASGERVMEVYTDRVRWVCCGRTTTLHRLHPTGPRSERCRFCPGLGGS